MAAMPRREELLGAIQRLTGAARVLHLPVIFTAQYTKGLGPICPEVLQVAQASPPVVPVEKLSFSCCGSEEFMRAVKDLRRPRLLLCGIESHVCVQQTAIDLMKDYFVYVAADAISSRHEIDHSLAIERIRDCGAVLTTVESAVFELLRQAGTDQVKQILPLFK